MKPVQLKPGDVALVDFTGVTGTKRRPAIVVSSAVYHAERPDIIFALVTTQISKLTARTDYILEDWNLAGLRKPSAVRIFLSTKPAAELTRIGTLSERDRIEVQKRLRLAIEF